MCTLNTKIPGHTRKCGKAFRNSWAYIDTMSLQEIPGHTYIHRHKQKSSKVQSNQQIVKSKSRI